MAVKRQVVFGVASLAALYVGVTNALGLGELRLDSALNQPLSATISIQGGDNLSPSDVLVSLAAPDAFEKAGIDRPHFLTDLRFIPVVENSRLIIRVESNRPVREPYLNFLVELRRPNGRMLREYTVLLDPPLFDGGAPAAAPVVPATSVASSSPATRSAQQPASPALEARPAAAPTGPRRQREPLTVAAEDLPNLAPDPSARTHRTVSGDTLWDLAVRHRPDRSIAIRDNMLAIKALNPEAFVNGDLNRLRVGQELVLPTPEQLRSAGSQSAVAGSPDVAPRSEADATPRTPLDGTASAEQSAAAGSASGTDIVEAVEPPTAGAREEAIVSGQLRIEETTVSAAEADAAELLGRLQSLEARFNVLLNELDARDRQIASLQAELEVLRQARDAEESADAFAGVPGGVLGGGEAQPGPASVEGSDAPGSVQAEVLPTQEVRPQGFLATWWPAFVALGAFLLGLLAAGLRSRSPREEEEVIAEDIDEPTSAPVRPGTALIGSSMVARPVAVQQPKPVDPLDGVELYVTYGRFAEARSMLDKAIAEEPARLDLRYKQLRVLAELGDSRAFEQQEQEILELDGDEERIAQIKARFPEMFDDAGLVQQIDRVEPLFDDEDLEGAYERTDEINEIDETGEASRQAAAGSQLNLNDFTLDPDWDLIEGLTPAPRKNKNVPAEDEAEDIFDSGFESTLHEFPEVEELDDTHEQHFRDDENNRRK